WVQAHYAEKILDTFRAERPEITRLHFTVRVNGQARPRLSTPTPDPVAEPEAAPAQPTAKVTRDAIPPKGDALSGSALDPKMTFDSFVPGGSNEIALGIARQVASAAL